MEKNIILIGPVGVGKSTVAEILSKKINLPQISMDKLRLDYYRELGYDEEFRKFISEKEGFAGVIRYWKVFDAYSVERIIQDYPKRCIIDMGGGSTYCVYPDDFNRVKKAFENHFTFLLMPNPDKNKSLIFLNKRTRWEMTGRNINRDIINHESNYLLANYIVYTEDQNPDQIADKILQLLPDFVKDFPQ